MAFYPVVSRGIGRNLPSKIELFDGHAEIVLSRGFRTAVDIADVPDLAGYAWRTLINSQTGHAYAVRFERGKCILMHRSLLDAPKHLTVDHIDGDGLNNRRQNIRLATPSQNIANSVVCRRNKLGVKGAYEREGRFRACIKSAGKTIMLGTYDTAEEANAAYAGAARILFGEFAKP